MIFFEENSVKPYRYAFFKKHVFFLIIVAMVGAGVAIATLIHSGNHLNSFDSTIIRQVNQFSQKSWLFDKFTLFLSANLLLKGGVLSTIAWWVWFQNEDRPRHRQHIVATLASCIVAVGCARIMALSLPFRLRPLHEASLNFLLPYSESSEALEEMSSFPSDHAVLFFTLSLGLLFASRKAGIIALSYTLIFIIFPRIYLGLHYPTDIIEGAIIGTTIALIFNVYLVKTKGMQSILNLSNTKPQFFYPLLFLLTYQISDLFEGIRSLASGILQALKSVI